MLKSNEVHTALENLFEKLLEEDLDPDPLLPH